MLCVQIYYRYIFSSKPSPSLYLSFCNLLLSFREYNSLLIMGFQVFPHWRKRHQILWGCLFALLRKFLIFSNKSVTQVLYTCRPTAFLVFSCVVVVQCPTLCSPLDCSLHEVLEAKISSLLASGLTSVYFHLCQGNKLVNRQNKDLVAFIEVKL